MSDPDERGEWIKSIHSSIGSDHPGFDLGDPALEIARLATPDAVREVRALMVALARVMPPRTSLRHAVAFMFVAVAAMRGQRITLSELLEKGGLDEAGMPLFGRSFIRSFKSLSDTKLVTIQKSDDGRSAGDLKLTSKGFDLLDKALSPLR